jgi:hypothetical protein
VNGDTRRTWWESLRHSGLLLSPAEVTRLESEYQREDLAWYRVDQLRREVNRLEAGQATPGDFVSWVLEHACSFNAALGTWRRGSSVPAEYSHALVTGETLRPRHLWQGKGGGILPVFFDDNRQLGRGRSRKRVSDTVQWLRRAGQHLAILTNGRQWRLVFAGLDFDASCEWDVDLWFEEGIPGPQLEALRRLLHPKRFDPSGDDSPPLLEAIQASRRGQSELSATLGERVRAAVEELVQAHGEALKDPALDASGADIYRAAVRVVMRLVVVLFAESRDLLPRHNPVYHDAYGLQGLFEGLERIAVRGRSRLAHRSAAWPRILALFRLIYGGSHHEALQIPRYGGDLFKPGNPESQDPMVRALTVFESACFNPDHPLVSDAVVWRMLELLTRTQVRVRQGRSSTRVTVPVDFSDLSSEYIGILYEGLLDYELRPAPDDEPIVFLAVGNEPALPMSRLEGMEDRQIKDLFESLKKTGDDNTEEAEDAGTEEEASAEEVQPDDEPEPDETGDEETVDGEAEDDAEQTALETAQRRALAWTQNAAQVAGLVKKPRGRQTPERALAHQRKVEATARQLVRRVVLPGEWYLVRWGGTRKGAGTFYTRPQLAVPTVHRTLRPLVWNPPENADGTADTKAPVDKWSPKTPEDILRLKACDPGCGSGSFLVASLRFLTDAVYEALHVHGRLSGDATRPLDELLGLRGSSEEDLQALRLPSRPEDDDFEPRTKAILRRYVVERCIYGVDLDPLATELCKLSLWIETMDRDLPFSFLDHKIKTGNSLVGAWFDQFQHYPAMAWKNREGGDKSHSNGVHFEKDVRTKAIKAFTKRVQGDLVQFIRLERKLSEPIYEDPAKVHDDALKRLEQLHLLPVQDSAEKARLYHELIASEEWQALKAAFDLWCACWFWPADHLDQAPLASTFPDPEAETQAISSRVAVEKRFFHWELEFPDVFSEVGTGFDAVLGNPPWDIAKPSSKEFFSNTDPLYRAYGKQEALRKQTEYFASEAIERDWLDYAGDFKAQSNCMRYTAIPYGDPKRANTSQDRFSLARGKANLELHDLWRKERGPASGYADASHPYLHQGSADLNLYKLFLERGHAILKNGGRLGFIVPSGLYSDHGTGPLRDLFLSGSRWEWLFGFENREKVFDIDSRFKFNPVIVQKGGRTEAIQTAFMRRKLEDWENAEDYATPYTVDRVAQFSPKSRAILEIQSSRDLDILERIYASSVLLGDDGQDGCGIKYACEFHMTNDSRLFPPRPQWEAQGYKPDEYSRWLKGKWRPRTKGCPAPPGVKRVEIPTGVILSRDEGEWISEDEIEDTALPLYEGRMIGQYDFSQKGWVSGKGRGAVWRPIEWSKKRIEPQFLMGRNVFLEEVGQNDPRALIMDVTSTTNERTVISTFGCGHPCGHKAPTLTPISKSTVESLALVGLINSFGFDFLIRARLGGNSLIWSVLEATAVPAYSSEVATGLSRLVSRLCLDPRLFAPSLMHVWKGSVRLDPPALTLHERTRLRAILDASVAHLYGLDSGDLRHVLAHTDHPKGKAKTLQLNPKGFWRSDASLAPELRHSVLSQVALTELAQSGKDYDTREEAVSAWLNVGDGKGWMVPDTLRLSDYDLGHDDRAKVAQPVAACLGPRFNDWQLEQDPDESWRECELHSRNLLGEQGYSELMVNLQRGGEVTARDEQNASGNDSGTIKQARLF